MSTSLHAWIIEHDNKRLFLILYIGLAVVLSIWISLFWLAAIVGVHFVFEVVRQYHLLKKPKRVLAEVFWELKLDLALVLFALALALYMEILLGAVSIGLAGRLAAFSRTGRLARVVQLGAKAGPRFAGWQKILRGFFLSVDDLAQVGRALVRNRKKETVELVVEDKDEIFTAAREDWGSWGKRWGKGDWFAIGMLVICLVLIAAAPLLTEHTIASILVTLGDELKPFPGT